MLHVLQYETAGYVKDPDELCWDSGLVEESRVYLGK